MDKRDYDVIFGLTNALNRDNGAAFTDTGRLKMIEDYLKDSYSYTCLNPDGKFSRIYARGAFLTAKCPVVISAHIDCKQKDAVDPGIYYPFCRRTPGGKCLQGTFDNAITNAAALLDILDGDLEAEVAVAFTGDEEVNSNGAAEVMRFVKENCRSAKAVTYITLDVTYDNAWGKAAFTIENNYMSRDDLGNIWLNDACFGAPGQWKYLPRKSGAFPNSIHEMVRLKEESMPDESEAYSMAENARAFSICIPTDDNEEDNFMHTDYGIKVRIEDFDNYRKAVAFIANRFTVPRKDWAMMVC